MSGLPPDYIPYSAAEIAIIKSRYPAEGPTALLSALPTRNRTSIANRARSLGIRYSQNHKQGHAWTDEENRVLRQKWPLLQRRKCTTAQIAAQLKLSVSQVYRRAADLGLRKLQLKDPPWSEEEKELLMSLEYMAPPGIRRRLKLKGFHRTDTAISLMRNRLGGGARHSSEAYSARAFAALLGGSPSTVTRWIRQGMLKATPRTDDRNAIGGPGDQWLIYPRHAREFLLMHTAQVDISAADKFWLFDLLAGGHNNSLPTLHQETCGYGDGGGYDEMRVTG